MPPGQVFPLLISQCNKRSYITWEDASFAEKCKPRRKKSIYSLTHFIIRYHSSESAFALFFVFFSSTTFFLFDFLSLFFIRANDLYATKIRRTIFLDSDLFRLQERTSQSLRCFLRFDCTLIEWKKMKNSFCTAKTFHDKSALNWIENKVHFFMVLIV